MATNPFNPGDGVWWDDEIWLVKEVDGDYCLIADIGENVSNVIQERVHYTELELDDFDDDDLDDDDGPDENDEDWTAWDQFSKERNEEFFGPGEDEW